jgi:hypothetical protein
VLAQNRRKYHFSHYEDPEKFAEIYWLFSREAVAGGSLEKFAETLPKKRGRGVQRGLLKGAFQSIDDSFLEELDEFRDELARAFKNANPNLHGETLITTTVNRERLFDSNGLLLTQNTLSAFTYWPQEAPCLGREIW